MPDDREIVAVWQAEQAQKCRGCGRWEWEHEENPEAWRADNYLCHWCEQLEQLGAVVSADGDTHGMKLGLYRSPREEVSDG